MDGPVWRSLVLCLEKAIELRISSTRIAHRIGYRRWATLCHSPGLTG